MAIHLPTRPQSADPRTIKGAYVSAAPNLYRVLGIDDRDRIVLEDCLTLVPSHVDVADLLAETNLVKRAPTTC